MNEVENKTLPDEYQGGFRNKPGNIDGLRSKPGAEYLFDKAWLDKEKDLPLFLDIGAGMGRFLMGEAEKHPSIRYVGVDPDYQCSKKVLQKLDNRHRRGMPLERVRYFHGSVYFLLDELPDLSVDQVYVNYPDPWFKRKHLKRRLVRVELFDRLKPLLKPGARVYVQTDIDDYRKVMEEAFEKVTGFKRIENAETFFTDLTTTLYQEKAEKKNHSRFCYLLEKNDEN